MIDAADMLKRSAKRALLVSLAVSLLGGCAFIFWRWHARHDPVDAALRCFTYAAFIAAVHAAGYRFYLRSNGVTETSTSSRPAAAPLSLVFILVQQAFALLVGSMILDGGGLFQIALAACLAYWLTFVIWYLMNHGRTTRVDEVLFSVGYWPLAVIIAILQHAVWWLKGLS